jgi:hypothetical protein
MKPSVSTRQYVLLVEKYDKWAYERSPFNILNWYGVVTWHISKGAQPAKPLHAAYNLATRGDESKREIKPLRFFFTEQEARNFIHSYKIGDRFLDRYI